MENLHLVSIVNVYVGVGFGLFNIDFQIKYRLADSLGLKVYCIVWYVFVALIWPLKMTVDYEDNRAMLEAAVRDARR